MVRSTTVVFGAMDRFWIDVSGGVYYRHELRLSSFRDGVWRAHSLRATWAHAHAQQDAPSVITFAT